MCKMKVELKQFSQNGEELIGIVAGVCYDSKNPQSTLKHVVESGHTSVLEHFVFTFYIEGISRACLAQLTRHRLASFTVQSQRYVKINIDQMKGLVVPPSIVAAGLSQQFKEKMIDDVNFYLELIKKGIPPEDARYATPQACPTKLYVTMNARELLHFFSLRTCNRAQWEIRRLADQMLVICKQVAPHIFENAGPSCVSEGKCKEQKGCGNPRRKEEWEEE